MALFRIVAWCIFAFVLAAALGLYALSKSRSQPMAEPKAEASYGAVPDFTFENAAGGTTSRKDLEGFIWVADFFFGSCKGVCPNLSGNMREVQRALADRPDVKLISFTVDPARDSAERLREYARKWQAIPGKWLFLRSSQKAIYALAHDGLKLGATNVPGEILHSNRFVVIGPDGDINGYYQGNDWPSVQRLIADVSAMPKAPPR